MTRPDWGWDGTRPPCPRGYATGEENVTGISNGFSLVSIKNFISSACSLFLRDNIYIYNNWLDSMTDFNEMCYRAVTAFLTLQNVQPLQQVHNRTAVVCGEYRRAVHDEIF